MDDALKTEILRSAQNDTRLYVILNEVKDLSY
jgi:hypothetical protein